MDFLLVHGAWHGGWCWAEVARRLQAAGHRVLAPSLTGLADRAHLFGAQVSLATHVEDVVRLAEFEGLDGFVLVGHSYGGNVITGAADRLRGRIRRCVYLDAVVPPDDARRWRWCDFNTEADRAARLAAIAGPGMGVGLPPPPASAFGIEDPALAARVEALLTPMPAGTYTGEIELSRGASSGLDRTYVAAAAPVYAPMRPVAERVRADASWRFLAIDTGHDMMLTAPDELARILLAG